MLHRSARRGYNFVPRHEDPGNELIKVTNKDTCDSVFVGNTWSHLIWRELFAVQDDYKS